jgi:hypothetical protein
MSNAKTFLLASVIMDTVLCVNWCVKMVLEV